ncbi:MAG: trigger factor [Euryarchaeota archaeon]|nr:trigger factor [Euryarchaeota archaeon]|tara:strand:+ start:77 stop:1429 length:1353 start_codon:yes stop_codon:yes gene_type:complete
MQISQESIDALRAHVSVTLEKSDYEDRVLDSLKSYKKQAQMPGFRKGKIPMGLIRKQYGKSILADVVNKLLSEALQKYVMDNKLDILGNPIPSENLEDSGDWENPDAFTFHYEIGLAPDIKLDLKKAKFIRHTIPVDKKAIDSRITDMQRQHGKVNDVEVAGAKDMLLGTFVQLDEKGEILEGGIENRSSISIEFVEDKKTQKKLIGSKLNDVVVLDPAKVSKGHDDLGKMLGITQEQVHDLKGEFKFVVEEIKNLEEHEVNQELFDKIYPQGEVKNLKDFKGKIEKDLEDYFDRDAEWVFRRRFVVDLVEHMKIELPDAFLKRWIMLTNEKPVTAEQLDSEFSGYADSLRWQLVQKEVMADQDIKVTADELEIEARKFISGQYAQYGMPMDEETMSNMAKNMLAKDEERRKIADVIIERKVVDHLKTLVSIKDKSISYDKFTELAAEVK